MVETIQQTVPPIPDGVVTSPQALNMVLTNDPNYEGSEGDLVFLYEMWKHFTVLDSLAEITPRWATSTRWSEQAGFIRHTSGSVLRTAQSLNAFDSQPEKTDVEVVAKVRAATLSGGHSPGVIVRGSGETAGANGVTALAANKNVVLGRYSNGAYSEWGQFSLDFSPGQWLWIRLRTIGDQISLRCWLDGRLNGPPGAPLLLQPRRRPCSRAGSEFSPEQATRWTSLTTAWPPWVTPRPRRQHECAADRL